MSNGGRILTIFSLGKTIMNQEEVNALTIIEEKSKISLENNASDRTASALKAALGAVPVVGSVLQEAVSVIIPNQRIDRIALMLKCFAQKVKDIEDEVLRQKMRGEEFTDLLEDAIPQAARSLSDDRRDYIAAFLKNSLTREELEHIHKKKLLSILGELNDAEIIFLRRESLRQPEKQQLYETHEVVLSPVRAGIGSPREDHDKNAFRRSFQDKLHELGLLRKKFVRVQQGKMPEMDEKTGMLKAQFPELTQLGKALLRYIDFPSSSDIDEDGFNARKQQNEQSN